MNKEKPSHLKEYDRRMFEGQNMMSLGNVFYKKNEKLFPKEMKDQNVQSGSPPQASPYKDPSSLVQKYDIFVDNAQSQSTSPYGNSASNQKERVNVLSKNAQKPAQIQVEYHGM